MRPARIEVFDGLRVATEHVEHLQDSLHSSIQDLREAVGVGRVIRGFQVEREGDAGIVVQPGLAFDDQARRLALDEPRRVEASIPPGRDVQYVCLGHETVEEGEVEGRPTLIWDSVAVSLQDAAPGAGDDLLAVAKLVRPDAETTAGFKVVRIDAGPGEEVPPPEPEAEAPETEAEAPEPEAEAPEIEAETPEADPAAPPAPRMRQGVVRLPALDVPQPDAVAALRAALDEERGGEDAAQTEISIALATAEVAGGIDVEAITCTVHLAATISHPDGTVGRLESVARGDATLEPPPLARFGLSTVRSVPPPDADGPAGAWVATELTEEGVATLPLGEASADASVRELLRGLRLVTDIREAAPDGVGVSCALAWSGPVDDRRVQAVEQEIEAVSWSAAIGWKALGR